MPEWATCQAGLVRVAVVQLRSATKRGNGRFPGNIPLIVVTAVARLRVKTDSALCVSSSTADFSKLASLRHSVEQAMDSDRMDRMLEEAFQIHGKDKKGRKILRIVGKFFPARELMAGGGEAALRSFLERRVFPELQGGMGLVVVYMHTEVERSENFPGVAALRSVYESLPAAVRDGIRVVYFLHPGLKARLFFATFGRFVFSAGLYGKLKYVNRLEFLWEHMRRGEVEVPEFVLDHDDELEHRPLMDYCLVESDRHHRSFDAPAMDSAAMHSLRCIY